MQNNLQQTGVFGYEPDAYLRVQVEQLEAAVGDLLCRGPATIGDLRVMGVYLDAVAAKLVQSNQKLAAGVNLAMIEMIKDMVHSTGGVTAGLVSALTGSWALQDMLENVRQAQPTLVGELRSRTLN